MKLVFSACCVALFLMLTACSDEAQSPVVSELPKNQLAADVSAPVVSIKSSLPRVKEVFEIGEGVYARALAVDEKQNSLWVGTSVGVHEVDLVSKQLRNTFTRDSGLANEYVFSILVDNKGDKWFGTNGGGASQFNGSEWKTYFPMHGLADYWVYSFAQQSSGAVWIGTWNGVNRLDSEKGHMSTYVQELINEWVYGIDVDSRDRVWFGTEGGVSMYDGSQWRSWNHEDGLGAPNSEKLPLSANTGLGTRSRHDLSVTVNGQLTYNPDYVFSVYVDSEDVVYVGTWGGGVSIFNGKTWSNLTMRDGLAGNIVFSITQDKNGVFWFGTNNGVSRYDGSSWQNIGREQGLESDHVYALAAVPDGDVWVGTKNGVARIGY